MLFQAALTLQFLCISRKDLLDDYVESEKREKKQRKPSIRTSSALKCGSVDQ